MPSAPDAAPSTEEVMRVHRFHSPFKHWMRGLFVEIASFSLFIFALFLVAVAVTWIF